MSICYGRFPLLGLADLKSCLALVVLELCLLLHALYDSAYRQGGKARLLPKKRRQGRKEQWAFFAGGTPQASQQLSF